MKDLIYRKKTKGYFDPGYSNQDAGEITSSKVREEMEWNDA